jgi:hypothetical protein
MSQNAVVSCNRRLLAPAIARTRLNIHLRSEDFVRIVLRGVVDVLLERSADMTAEWLEQHPEVEIVSRGRCGLYAQGARRGADQSAQNSEASDLWSCRN